MSTTPSGVPPNVVVFGPNANCTLEICPVQMSVYGYRPSLAANIIFIALYAAAAALHTYLGVRWKQWWFMICMNVGALNAIAGYAGRVMLHYNPWSFAFFMLQIICVTTGPVYYCAAIYITLSLAIASFAPELSRFNPKLFYYIFIPCDLVSLVLQGAGGGLSTSSSGQSKVGVNLALAGLSLQVLTILLFCGFFGDFLVRYFRSEPSRQKARDHRVEGRVRLFFGFMSLAVALILVRCAYRLVELNEGYSGHLVKDEPLFIGLEGVVVVASVYCLMVGHPGFVFKPAEKTARAEDETELATFESSKVV